LGFFEPGSVIFNTITRKGEDDILDVEVRVKERNTGQISLGAGYSTATGMFLQASVAQNNFMGKGQNLSFSLSLSKVNQTYNLGFTEPYLFDTKWTAGFDLFNQSSSTSDAFSYKRKGFALRAGHPIAEYTRLYVTYKFEDTTLKDINDPTINEALENGIASSIGTTIVTDKRNNKFEPSAGYYLSLATEFAGIGGDKKWGRYELDARYFKQLIGDLVLRTRFYTGALTNVSGKAIPRTEKFSLGGARNLRGYQIEGVGPKDHAIINGINKEFNLRGQFSIFTNLEIEHPLAREAGLKWVVFFDAGNIFNRYLGESGKFAMKSDYGFGFRWFSPIGVLRFEFGYPINPDSSQQGSQFHFDIGQIF
jgi:outer membrane protein insertion porin family